MSLRSGEFDEEGRGLGSFLRSLFSGIPWSESARSEEHFKLAKPLGGALSIHNANGRTRVVGEERDDVEVDVEKHARAESDEAARELLDQIEVVSSEVDGTLEIEVDSPSRWNRHGGANLFLRVPRALRVSVVAANGKVCLEGLRASASARSSNGPVRISDIVGDVEVYTSNAKVVCDCTCGRLKARSSNSKIQLGRHKGSIDASTSNGVIHAELAELGKEGIVLATSNGRIILELPEEVDAEVDIRVDNGVIRSSRELSTQPPDDHAGRMRGRLGRGGTPIKLRTSNGTISMR